MSIGKKLAIWEMILCAALWSIAGILIKLLPWNGFAVTGIRGLISGITIYICMVIFGIRPQFNKKTITAGILNGCVALCFVCANKLTTAANAIVLQYTSPVFLVLFYALFYKAKIRRIDMVTVLVTLAGITLFFFDQLESGYILGNCLAILAGIFQASMFLAVGNLDADARYSGILIGQIFTFLLGLPFVFLTKPLINTTTVTAILILGVFQLGLSYVLYVKASKACSPLACCLIGVIEPILNPVWVMIFDGETPGIFALIGGIIVVVTVTVWCVLDGKSTGKQTLPEN